ncbi:MAG: T9SS type A sorting domain-containing protein [Bacteroidales bacterium]|jgi:hypothetical protein|nr:T9SS type A sorting domain-containing protein [Bacteroidales bacterium]
MKKTLLFLMSVVFAIMSALTTVNGESIDARLSEFISPSISEGLNLSSSETVTVQVVNNGSMELTGYTLYLKVDDNEAVSQMFSGRNIAASATLNETFAATADLSSVGEHTLKAWIQVNGDGNHGNDTIIKQITNIICSAISVFPLVEDFEGTALGACWKDSSANSKNVNELGIKESIKAKSGNNVYQFSSYSRIPPPATEDDYFQFLVTPELSTSQFKAVQFYYKRDRGSADGFKIGYSTETNNKSDFTWFPAVTGKSITSAWQLQYQDEIPAGAKYIAIAYVGSSSEYRIQIDSLVISAYTPPNNLAQILSVMPTGKASSMTSNEEIKVSFKNTGFDTIKTINISYQIDDNTVVTENASNLNVVTYETCTCTFSAKANLSAIKTYSIKAWLTLTGDSDNSDDTVKANIINTDCITLPYSEGFESSNVNNCWDFVSMNTANGEWNVGNDWGLVGSNTTISPKQGDSCLKFSSYTNAADYRQYIVTPRLPQTLKLRTLSFYYNNNNKANEILKVGYSSTTSNLSDFVWDESINQTAFNGWQQYYKNNIETDIKYIAVLYAPNASRYNVYVDDLSIFETADNDGQTLEIVAPNAEGTDLTNSETITVKVKNMGRLVLTVFNASYAIGENTPVTEPVRGVSIAPGATYEYSFTAKADLSALGNHTLKAWVDVAGDENKTNDTVTKDITVITCAFSFPYTQNFENAIEMNCLKGVSANSPNASLLGRHAVSAQDRLQGNYVWRFSGNQSVSADEQTKTQTLIFPEMPAGGDTLKNISFYYKSSTSYYTADLLVGYSITTNDTNEFTWYDPVTATTNWNLYKKENIPTGAKYIAVRFVTLKTQYIDLYIDSVVITGKKAVANDLAVSEITYPTSNSANLTSDEKVMITLKNNGFAAAASYKIHISVNGAPALSENVTTEVPAYSSQSYTLTTGIDISGFNVYAIKVWAEIAGDADNSNDTAYKTVVNTDCTVTLPYTQGFESSDILPCWQLATNSPNSNASKWNVGWGIFSGFKHGGDSAFRFYSDGVTGAQTGQVLISPELPATTNAKELHFYYGVNKNTEELLTVGYSITTNDPNAFIWADTLKIPEKSSNKWFEYIAYLQTDVKYFAIRYYSSNKYYAYIDDLKISEIPTTDASFEDFAAPLSGVDLSETENIKVMIKNNGVEILDSAVVYISVNGGEAMSEIARNLNLPFGSETIYNFTNTVDLSHDGDYKLKAWVSVAGDNNHENDTVAWNVTNVVCGPKSLPFVESFEVSPLSPCYKIVNNSENNTMGQEQSQNSGDAAAGYGWFGFSSLSYNPTTNYEQFLVAPKLVSGQKKLLSLYFYVDSFYSNRAHRFSTGYSATTNDLSSFIWVDTVLLTSDSCSAKQWHLYSSPVMPEEAKYIAFAYNPERDNSGFYIDSLRIDEVVTPVPVTDLRVLSFVDFPATDTLAETETEDIPVKVKVRNDSIRIDNSSVGFTYYLEGISGNASNDEKHVYELYKDSAIEKDAEFVYTFDDDALIVNTGTYKIRAWVTLNGYTNLHNDTVQADLIVVAPTVVGNEVIKPGFKAVIYPNPSNGNLTITTSSRSTVEIMDIKGVVINRITVSGSKDLSLKSKGIYVLRFTDNFGNKATERIIVK